MKKFLKVFYSKFFKHEILEELVLNNVVYRVVDKKNRLLPMKNERALVFKKSGDTRLWIHSKIYINPKKVFQPHELMFQKIFDCWGNVFTINKALVLGCAGCTLPRFLVKRFSKCKVTGIEYLKEFIDIANKYFFVQDISDRFDLIEADAFEFVENEKLVEKQDLIMVDIFDENQCPNEVFSNTFIKSLYNQMSDSSIVVFNLLNVQESDVFSFCDVIKEPFDEKYIVSKNNRFNLLLIKSNDRGKIQQFIRKVEEI